MFQKDESEKKEFTREELQDILTGVKQLSKEDLAMVWGGGDDRVEYTLDAGEIERDIFGSKF